MSGMNYKTEIIENPQNCQVSFHGSKEGQVHYVSIEVSRPEKGWLKPLKLRVSVSAARVQERWNPKIHLIKALNLDWFQSLYQTNGFTGAPVECLIAQDDSNCVCAGLSDTLETIGFTALPIEETAKYGFDITLFQNEGIGDGPYRITMRLDFRLIPYYEALAGMAGWWEELGLKPAKVPEASRELVYSTWYSYHQEVEQEALLMECRAAKKLGLKTLIIDDGWQTEDNSRGYGFCGDWQVSPSKFPDIRKFIEEIHGLGMKVMFWYSVPFIGEKAECFGEFKDMLIDPEADREWHVLDPRYKKVRDFIINTYETALREWNLDGFKLDFADEFVVTGFSGNQEDDRRDFISVTEAAAHLFTECMLRLKRIKPDILLEFRQTYNGPGMRTYGNIFRAVDCPMGAMENRVRVTDIRLLAKESAVHSDMIMWNKEDSTQDAALQIIHVLFSVPQISMRIEELSEAHYKMLHFYCSLWEEYKDVFINGDFRPLHPRAGYSVIMGVKDNRMACTYHIPEIINIRGYDRMVFVNGSHDKQLAARMEGQEAVYMKQVYSPEGDLISNEEAKIKTGLQLFDVPVAGTMILHKK